VNHYIDAFKRYFDVQGRSTRMQYWMFYLLNLIAIFVFAILDASLNLDSPFFYMAYVLVSFIPVVTVGVRRMHDSGRSGWWLIVPIVNLVFLCASSQVGKNEYGEDVNAVFQ